MHVEHTLLSLKHAHMYLGRNSLYSFFSSFLGYTLVQTLHSKTECQFKHIKSTADYVCRYYPKNQSCAFSQKDTNNYRSDNPWVVSQLLQCVYTIWHGWNNSTNKNREKILISTFPTCCLSQTTKIVVPNRAWNDTKKSWRALWHTRAKTNHHYIKYFKLNFCIYWQLLGLFCNT